MVMIERIGQLAKIARFDGKQFYKKTDVVRKIKDTYE